VSYQTALVDADNGYHRYELSVVVGGSAAEFNGSATVHHHPGLHETESVLYLDANSEPQDRNIICAKQRIVPSAKRRAWVQTVPMSCLPHLNYEESIGGERLRQADSTVNDGSNDYEDDFGVRYDT
jgi:hypothetical protein